MHPARASRSVRLADMAKRTGAELLFLVEEADEGGLTARAVGVDIFTEADDMESLTEAIRDAVHCHFEPGTGPSLVRLHIVRDQVIRV